MRPFFLRATLDPDASPAQGFVYWAWRYLWLCLAGLGVGALSLLLAVGPYPLSTFQTYLDHPILLVLNLALPLGLILLLDGLTRRPSLSFLLTAALVVGFSLVNYYKLAFRDDPLMFTDLFLLKEAGNMMGRYQLFWSRKVVFCLAAVGLGWLFLKLLVPGRAPGKGSGRWITLLLGAAVLGTLFPVCLSDRLYAKTGFYEHIESRWSATQQYIARGFLYPFLHSISDAVEQPPEGYNRAQAEAMLEVYSDQDIPQELQVNVVAVMLEAFQDFSRFGTPELTRDIYAPFHALEAESYTGDLVVNIFAGGTVDTERGFLTGFSSLPDFRGVTNSYPWYFRSQGYQTTGLHPSRQWFYNRSNINEYLGFQDYGFMDNYFEPQGLFSGDFAPDSVLFPALIRELEERQAGAPIFSFSVTYQGHGPYASTPVWYQDLDDFFPSDAPYTQEEMGTMANYFACQENTMQYLIQLRDFLAAQDEPYVLVLFGDHNPWMGDGNSIYQAMGLNLDQSTQEGFANYYSTRYLIWANDAAKEVTGSDFVGEGPAISPCFLMTEIFDLCGWEGPAYLQATRGVARQVGVQHTSGVYLEDGRFTQTLTPEGEALTQDFQFLQYYVKGNFLYSHVS